MNNELLSVVLTILLLFGGSCTEISLPRVSTAQSARQQASRLIEGHIGQNVSADWRSSLVKKHNNFKTLYFIDGQKGWASNETIVFRTTDSGKTWIPSKPALEKDSKIVELNFEDEFNGWLIACTERSYVASKSDHLELFWTNDGAKSWHTSYVEQSFMFRDAFFSGVNVWITGTRFSNNSEMAGLTLLFYSPETSSWADISSPIKVASYDSDFAEGQQPVIGGISVLADGCWIAVNQIEKIFRSCDNGTTWRFLTRIGNNSNDFGGLSTNSISSTQNSLLTFQTVSAVDHGIGTVLTVIPTNQLEEKQVSRLIGYVATEAFMPSETEFFLAARQRSFTKNADLNKSDLLHTTDQGRSWKQIFSISEEFVAVEFTKSDPMSIWVLTKGGNLYEISRKTPRNIN